ncbi:hypothetical protein [Actinoplanes sp. NPDC049265]|uniref:hypothetical protein n=1 Tax=Actinoplanes sp. NPDC049265 TaxID=3363902 RepID=UPI003719722E
MTPAKPFVASLAALGVSGIIAVPAPALAADPGCAQPERYGAQSGAELLEVTKLTLRKAGGERPSSRDHTPSEGAARDRTGSAPGSVRGAGSAVESRGATNSVTKPAPVAKASRGPKLGAGDEVAGAGGAAGGQGGGAGQSILAGAAGAAASPTPALGGSNVAGRSDKNGELSTRERREVSVSGVHVGEARSAMVGVARPNAAAVTRMINSAETSRASTPLVRQAPPNGKASERDTPAAEAGPVLLDEGSLVANARWQDAMACGEAYGDITRAAATLGAAQVSGIGRAALVAVPEEVRSVSTTALERTAQGARAVAAAKMSARSFELLDGAVQIEVLRSPTLTTSMSTVEGGDVTYVPAAIRVSGDGIKTTKLDAAGDSIEMTFSERQTESLRLPEMGGKTLGDLPVPAIPGLPRLPDGAAQPESAPAPSSGTSVKISLGRVRQASQGRAIAAKASAISVGIAQGGTTHDGYGRNADVALDMEIGALESASVAPEPVGGAVSGAEHGGRGGGLPVTGPGVGAILVIGGALLASGVVAFVLGRRRRRFEA